MKSSTPMKFVVICSAILLTVLLCQTQLKADLLLESFSGGTLTQNSVALPRVNGWSFSLNENLIVDSLGTFDVDSDGLDSDVMVGLWDADGELVSSTTLPSGTTSELQNGFRFQEIDPTVIFEGETYTIGALLENDGERMFFNVDTFVVAPEIEYLGPRFGAAGSGFSFPSADPGILNGTFGANLTFTAIPEPSCIFVVMILSTFALRREKRNYNLFVPTIGA